MNKILNKKLSAIGLCYFLSSAAAFAAPMYELTTLLGTSNQRMPYVNEILKNHLAIVPGNNLTDYTTGILYFSWRNGVHSVQTIQVLQEGGSATLADVYAAIDIASKNSALVLAPLGGDGIEELCVKMAEKSDTVFLVTLGNVGYNLSPLFTRCAAKNILFVTVLNSELSGLGEFASYGPLVRLAVPGMELSAPVDGDRRVSFLSDGFGMAVAAGKIAALFRKMPELKGAALLTQFLAETEELSSLRGKVTGAKAILRFEK